MLPAELPAEAERNRLLRRADWRFLLPTESAPAGPPRRCICFAPGLLLPVAAVWAETGDGWSEAPAGVGAYDLAVVVNPDRATLQRAWEALRPGGVCYSEWTRPLPGGAAGVRRRLSTAGFGAATCYWPLSHPDRGPVAAWLPLEAPGALRYFEADRSLPLAGTQRAAYHLKWRLWRLARGLGLALPICAVARKGTGMDEPGEVAGADSLRADWEALGLEGSPQPLSRLLLTGGLHTINRVVTLVFAGDEDAPRLVTKRARVPEAAASLAHEAAVLRALHASGQIDPRSVPQTLFYHGADCAPVLGQSVVHGAPIWLLLRRDNYARLAAQVTEWQAQLALGAPAAPLAAWCDRLVRPHLASFAAHYGGVLSAEQLRAAEGWLGQLGSLPLVCEHRDFAPGNVWLDGDDIAVIDWETAELAGLPALDLIYFLTFLTLAVEGVDVHGEIDMPRARATYRSALDPATPNGEVVTGCLRRYCQAVGIDDASLRPLRLLTWTMQAHLRAHAAAALAETPAQAAARSLFVQLWQEELACAAEVRV